MGKKLKEEESAGQLGRRYEWNRKEIVNVRIQANTKVPISLPGKTETDVMMSLRHNWDNHIIKEGLARAERSKKQTGTKRGVARPDSPVTD